MMMMVMVNVVILCVRTVSKSSESVTRMDTPFSTTGRRAQRAGSVPVSDYTAASRADSGRSHVTTGSWRGTKENQRKLDDLLDESYRNTSLETSRPNGMTVPCMTVVALIYFTFNLMLYWVVFDNFSVFWLVVLINIVYCVLFNYILYFLFFIFILFSVLGVCDGNCSSTLSAVILCCVFIHNIHCFYTVISNKRSFDCCLFYCSQSATVSCAVVADTCL